VKLISKFLLIVLITLIVFTGCNSINTATTGEQGQEIITAGEASELLGQEGVVFIDARNSSQYKEGHIKGAVNIGRSNIVVLGPFPNMLAPKEKIEKVLGSKGISNDTTVVIYDDNNNMDSARLWWTLKVYGHEKVKVVSGGLKALLDNGQELTAEVSEVSPVTYTAKEKNTELIATLADVKAQVDNPDENVVLLDTRSQEEYNSGTIPGSILIDYQNNNYNDGTYRSIQDIHIIYREAGIDPDKTVIMYCKTSIRAAQTCLALYNAGYRNLKVYDGAWIEWSSDVTLPVQLPDNNKVEANYQDNS